MQMHSRKDVTTHHSLMLHACETFCQALVQSANQVCSSRSWTAFILPSFNTLLICCSRFCSAICPD